MTHYKIPLQFKQHYYATLTAIPTNTTALTQQKSALYQHLETDIEHLIFHCFTNISSENPLALAGNLLTKINQSLIQFIQMFLKPYKQPE